MRPRLKEYYSQASDNDEALIDATLEGNSSKVRRLLSDGVDPYVRDLALFLAAHYKRRDAGIVLMRDRIANPAPTVN